MREQEYERPRDVIDLLEELKEKVENAKGVILSQNCMLNREECLEILEEITSNLPRELKQAKWVLDQQAQVMQHAQQEADSIIAESESRALQMIDEHDLTQQARQLAEEILQQANQQAMEIQTAAVNYAENKIYHLEETLTQILVDIRKDKQGL